MHPKPAMHKSRGFSLIEVLIALVILSVGLLGIAAMVSVSLKSKDSSYKMTQAAGLAQSMLDRMRANHGAATLGNYDIAMGTAAPTAPACVGNATACTPAQIASFDLADWKASLTNILPPDGDGSISTVAVAQMTQVTISITWNDQRANAAVAAPSAGTAAVPTTTTFTITSGL